MIIKLYKITARWMPGPITWRRIEKCPKISEKLLICYFIFCKMTTGKILL